MASEKASVELGPDYFSKQYLITLDRSSSVPTPEREAMKSDLRMSAQQQGKRLEDEISFDAVMTDKTHMILTCFAKISQE